MYLNSRTDIPLGFIEDDPQESHEDKALIAGTYSLIYIEGILPKGPYLPCVSMAGMALLAG